MPVGIFVPAAAADLALSFASDVDAAAHGAVLYRDSDSRWHALAPGTAGQALLSGGTGADPTWGSAGVTDHGALTGLGDDDHTQYIHNAPGSSVRNLIQASGDFIPLQIQASAGQLEDMLQMRDSAGGPIMMIGPDGRTGYGHGVAGGLSTSNSHAFLSHRTDTSGSISCLRAQLTVHPDSAATGSYTAISAQATLNPTAAALNAPGTLQGLAFAATSASANVVNQIIALQTTGIKSGTGVVTNLYGFQANVVNSNATGGVVGNTATIRAGAPTATGAITNLAGIRVENHSLANVTQSYAIRIINQAGGAGTTWSIRSEGGPCHFQAGTATFVPLTLQGAASQSANLQEWQSSAGTAYSTISENGYWTTRKTAAPADAELSNSEVALWLDATPGTTLLMIKAKDSAGAIRTGSVALT